MPTTECFITISRVVVVAMCIVICISNEYGSQCHLPNEQRSSSCHRDYHNPGDGDEALSGWHGGSGETPTAAILWKMEEHPGAPSKEFEKSILFLSCRPNIRCFSRDCARAAINCDADQNKIKINFAIIFHF